MPCPSSFRPSSRLADPRSLLVHILEVLDLRTREGKEPSPRVVCGTGVSVQLPEYANRRGAKSAKRVLRGLLSLLALPHTRDFATRSACESVEPFLVEAQSADVFRPLLRRL